jgi:polyferredoxin
MLGSSMQRHIYYRVIFTLILSGIMSASMTLLISSSYCDPTLTLVLPIWLRAWATAFTVIFFIAPYVEKVTTNLLMLMHR